MTTQERNAAPSEPAGGDPAATDAGPPAETHNGTGVARVSVLGRWRDVAVGTVAEAEQTSVRVLAGLRRGVTNPSRMLRGGAAAGSNGLIQRIDGLAERGAAERARGRRQLATTLDTAVGAVAASPVVARIVDAQLERVLRPLVGAVLDEILDMLEREPERIRSLVRSQRSTMVDELVGHIRSGAAAGDTNIDRLTSRVLHQNPAAVPPPSDPR